MAIERGDDSGRGGSDRAASRAADPQLPRPEARGGVHLHRDRDDPAHPVVSETDRLSPGRWRRSAHRAHALRRTADDAGPAGRLAAAGDGGPHSCGGIRRRRVWACARRGREIRHQGQRLLLRSFRGDHVRARRRGAGRHPGSSCRSAAERTRIPCFCERDRRGRAAAEDVEHVRGLLQSARTDSDHFHAVGNWFRRLIPAFVGSPRLARLIGWFIVAAALGSLFYHTLGVALGGHFYHDRSVRIHLAGMSVGTVILMIGAVLTLAMALPAAIALRRTDRIWPLRWLRDAALLFTLLSALVHFATEGFAALINLSIGLLAMAVLSYQLDRRG